jgi:hypothetical protein
MKLLAPAVVSIALSVASLSSAGWRLPELRERRCIGRT